MKFKKDFFPNYLKFAPVSLGLERSLECEIYSKQAFEHPVLDLGCGDGLFAFILFDEKVDTGIDPNPREIKRALQYNIYTELINCSGDKILKPDRAYNRIYSNSVLEHIPELEPVLKEIYRLLAADGYFYTTVPTHLFQTYTVGSRFLASLRLNSLAKRYERFYNRFWSQIHCYPPDSWADIFRRCGFKVVDIIEYGSKKTSLICGIFIPFALGGWIVKKLLNRWTICPELRHFLTWPLRSVIQHSFFTGAINIHNGGLVYFKLAKE